MERDFARRQIGRFAMMDRFPRTEEAAITDLVDALMTCPPTCAAWKPDFTSQQTSQIGKDAAEVLAQAVMEGFLDGATTDTRCPTAADIKAAICSRLEDWRPDPECPLCKGEGFPYVPGRGAGPRCSCWARRAAPVYPRNRQVQEELQAEVSRAAGAKRVS